ncbi:PREDICTED: RNA-binding protein SGN1-like [Nicrophorus vespilloides]|uniref:RNA-binding protein SGN1-like n=1 Tax=Nicrophorus vespilloides TaxID=110193 RepID=A0ABM1MQV6_NICVS|nr:PREDICTED: RNA-binding protein SGN1-like [Nicrophorus vespilloides]
MMSEIEVCRKSSNKNAVLERVNKSETLELEEMTANFQKMSIGDPKKVLVKDGKQLLKDIFSDKRLNENMEKNIKDNTKSNSKKKVVKSTKILKLPYDNMKKRQTKKEKRKVVNKRSSEIIEAIRKTVSNGIVKDIKINSKLCARSLISILMKNKGPGESSDEDNVSADDVEKSLENLKLLKEDKNLMKKSTEPVDENNRKKIEADSRSVFVGNVDNGTNAQSLEKMFSACGTIKRVSIPLNAINGKPKGFAYIEFDVSSSVEKAIKMSGVMLRGRPIQVKHKRTNKPGLSTTDRPSFEPISSRSRKIYKKRANAAPKVFNDYSFRNNGGATSNANTSKNVYVLNRKSSKSTKKIVNTPTENNNNN